MTTDRRKIRPLVGRADELALVLSAIEDATERRHVVIAGHAGVGKTRLAHETSSVLATRGWTCHHFAARPGGSAVPFFEFTPLLADSEAPTDTIDRFVWAGRKLTESGSPGRVVVVVDDCQWLGDVSAAFVCHLASATPVRLVLTRRRPAELPPPVASLIGEPAFEQVELFRLGRQGVVDLLRSLLGGDPDEALVARLWSLTQGNALYVTALVDAGRASGALAEHRGEWVLAGPFGELLAGVESAVALGLGTLSADESALVEMIAVSGAVSIGDLEQLGPGEALGSLERRGVVVARSSGRRTEVTLAHPVFDEVVLARLGPIGRRARERQLLEVSTSGVHRRRFSDRLSMALWAADLSIERDPSNLVELARELIEGFRSSLYPTRPEAPTSRRGVGASDHLELAARLAADAAEHGGGFAALEVLYTAQSLMGRLQEADAALARMRSSAQTSDERIAVALLQADRAAYDRDPDATSAAIAEAASLAEGGPLASVVNAQAAAHLLLTGPLARAVEVARSVLETPGVDAAAAARAGFVLVGGLCMQGRPLTALEFLDANAARLAPSETPQQLGALLFIRGTALIIAGSFEAAEALMRDGVALAEAMGHLSGVGTFSCGLGHTLVDQGRTDSATEIFSRAVRILTHLDPLGMRPAALAGLARAHAIAGRSAAARAAVDELRAGRPGPEAFEVSAVRAEAWTEFVCGERDLAVARLHDYYGVATEKGAQVGALMAAWDLGRFGETDAPALMLAAAAGVEGPGMACLADYARGLMANDPDLLEAAARALESVGARTAAAEAAVKAVEAHVARGQSARAEICLAYSRALVARCETVSTPILNAAIFPGLDAFRHLTKRERETAALAARGLSNQAIADLQHTSVRTVGNHLHRVYAKLGVSSRVELAELIDLAPGALSEPGK